MAAIYNILARSGSNGELIQKLFWEFGLSCEYNIQPNIPKIKNAVVVTYGYDLLPYVMTSHLLEVVGDAYAEGNKEVWDQFKEHYSGSGIYDNPNDITPEHWAEHVKNSMNFIISNFNLFNGNADSVLELIEGYTGPKYNIKLEDILNNPESVLKQISEITDEPIPDGVLDYYKKELETQQLRLAPYLEAYQKIS